MIHPIRKMGDPCLLTRSAEITATEFSSPSTAINSRFAGYSKHLGGVGIGSVSNRR